MRRMNTKINVAVSAELYMDVGGAQALIFERDVGRAPSCETCSAIARNRP